MAKKGLSYKLVRDDIPLLAKASENNIKTRVLTDNAAKETSLFKKLKEEIKELQLASPAERAEEMADVIEVLKALHVHYDLSTEEVFEMQKSKASEKGAFNTFTEMQGNW